MTKEELEILNEEFAHASKIEIYDGYVAITKEYPLDLLRVGHSKQVNNLLEKYATKITKIP